jgi:hypothetical protein
MCTLAILLEGHTFDMPLGLHLCAVKVSLSGKSDPAPGQPSFPFKGKYSLGLILSEETAGLGEVFLTVSVAGFYG